VDGSANLSGFTTSVYGPSAVLTASTGTVTGTFSSTQWGNGAQVSGLSLGLHTVKVTTNSTNAHYFESFDIITPVHSPKSNLPGDLQNTLLVGSNSLGDSRLLPAQTVKPLRNWAQAVGVSSNPTTTSASFVPIADMALNLKTSGNPIEISYSCLTSSVTPVEPVLQVYVDGKGVGSFRYGIASSTAVLAISDSFIVPVEKGNHFIQLMWSCGGVGTVVATSDRRNLTVMEL
jgi:hypothetical protein